MLARYAKFPHVGIQRKFIQPRTRRVSAVVSGTLPPLVLPGDNIDQFQVSEKGKESARIGLEPRSKSYYANHSECELLPTDLGEDFFKVLDDDIQIGMTQCFANSHDPDEKKFIQTKTSALTDIYKAIQNFEICDNLPKEWMTKIVNVLAANMYRGIPDLKCFRNFDTTITLSDPLYIHTDVVFQIYMIIVTRKAWADVIPPHFHKKIIYAGNSADIREREKVVLALVQTYLNFEKYRKEIINDVCNAIYDYVCGDGSPLVVIPCLGFIARIFNPINTATQPEFQKLIIDKVLPLLSSCHLSWYSKYIRRIFGILLQVNASNAVIILNYILHHWPHTSQNKQPLMIDLLGDVLEYLNHAEFKYYAKRIFKIYAKCAVSESNVVAEESFKIWQNKKIINLIKRNTNVIFEIMFDSIRRAMKSHWAPTTQEAAKTVMNTMNGLDQGAFEMASYSKHLDEAKMQTKQASWAYIIDSVSNHPAMGKNIDQIYEEVTKLYPVKQKIMIDATPLATIPKLSFSSNRRHSFFY